MTIQERFSPFFTEILQCETDFQFIEKSFNDGLSEVRLKTERHTCATVAKTRLLKLSEKISTLRTENLGRFFAKVEEIIDVLSQTLPTTELQYMTWINGMVRAQDTEKKLKILTEAIRSGGMQEAKLLKLPAYSWPWTEVDVLTVLRAYIAEAQPPGLDKLLVGETARDFQNGLVATLPERKNIRDAHDQRRDQLKSKITIFEKRLMKELQ